jgi:hypothetical protein
MTVQSALPLASSPALDQATVLTAPLPFSQMSGNTYVTVVYASPPVSGGGVERGRRRPQRYMQKQCVPVSLHRAGRVGLLQIAPTIKFAGAILVVLAATVLME